MRIAFVVGKFPKLSETFILNQITGLIDRGHEVTIYSGRPDAEDKVHPDVARYRLLDRVCYWPGFSFPLIRSRSPRSGAPFAGRGAAEFRMRMKALGRSLGLLNCASSLPDLSFPLRVLRATGYGAGNFDAIIAHFGHVGLDALRLREAGALCGNLLTFFHAYDMSVFLAEKGEGAYESLFQKGDYFLPVSRFWEKRLRDLGCPPQRTAVHRMGIDCTRFSFSPRVRPPDGITRIASVARLVEKKGIAYGLRALARVAERHPALEYTIIGDGPLRRMLEKLSGELQLGSRVRFRGSMGQEEIAAEMLRMHLFLAPSVTAANGDVEGLPVSLLEAMACGLPVLGTLHTGIPEAVEDGVSGCLVPERNVEALASGLSDLLDAPAAWPALGAAGRARVEREFDIEKLNDLLVERLQKMRGQEA